MDKKLYTCTCCECDICEGETVYFIGDERLCESCAENIADELYHDLPIEERVEAVGGSFEELPEPAIPCGYAVRGCGI